MSKLFFLVAMPECQRGWFRLEWYRNHDFEKGRVMRHVWESTLVLLLNF